MKKSLLIAAGLASFAIADASAEIDFYGKGNVSLEAVSEGDADTSELRSNRSRIGIKGSEPINESLQAIYQLEYQVTIDDSTTFSQRNIFIGVKGDFGTVQAGHFDTPLKQVQNKVDLFNDLRGDINNVVTYNDNRASNSVMYTSPVLGDVFQGYVDYINSEDEDVDAGVSVALTFTLDQLYIALAADENVEQEDASALRLVMQYQFDRIQLGLLAEESETAGGESESGVMASIGFKLNEKVDLKVQAGQSDIVEQGGETVSLGADYKLTKQVKTFAFYTRESADNDALDNDYLGVGLEVAF